MKKIIFALSLVAAVAVAPTVYTLAAKNSTVEVLDKGEGKKKKKKDCDAKCEKSKKSCCSKSSSEATAEPAK